MVLFPPLLLSLKLVLLLLLQPSWTSPLLSSSFPQTFFLLLLHVVSYEPLSLSFFVPYLLLLFSFFPSSFSNDRISVLVSTRAPLIILLLLDFLLGVTGTSEGFTKNWS